jgi:hypothetical protein
VTEPPELKGAPFLPAVKPSDIARQFANSKTIKAANPGHPETIAPALREINDLLKQDSTLSDLYLLRASLSCFVDAPPVTIIDDVQRATALHNPATSAFKTLREHCLRPSRGQAGRYGPAMNDLDLSIAQVSSCH